MPELNPIQAYWRKLMTEDITELLAVRTFPYQDGDQIAPIFPLNNLPGSLDLLGRGLEQFLDDLIMGDPSADSPNHDEAMFNLLRDFTPELFAHRRLISNHPASAKFALAALRAISIYLRIVAASLDEAEAVVLMPHHKACSVSVIPESHPQKGTV